MNPILSDNYDSVECLRKTIKKANGQQYYSDGREIMGKRKFCAKLKYILN